MKIDKSTVDQNKETLRSLIKSQKNAITHRTQEIKNIQKIYDLKKDDERLIGEQEVLDIRDRNEAEFIQASSGKEKKLEAIKQEFKATQKTLEKSKDHLQEVQREKIKYMNTEHESLANSVFDRSKEQIEDLNLATNNTVTEARKKAELEIQRNNHKVKMGVDQAAFVNAQKIDSAQGGQAEQLKKAQDKYLMELRRTQGQHKALLSNQLHSNENDFKERQRIFDDRAKIQAKNYDELIRSSKASFEQKYAGMIKQHDEVLTNLQERFKKDINKSVAADSKKYQAKMHRSEDPFYNITILSPTIREDKDAYYVDIKTQKHERDNFQLSANKRRVKLMFNRRSEERLDAPSGDISTTNRSETILKEFKVAEIVDDRNLKVSYVDGVLSYRLPKA